MATVILAHPVADFKNWKKVYDADAPRREGAGLKEIAVGQDVDKPGMVYMIFQTDNPAVVQQMMADPEMEKTMRKAGVTGPPTATIIE